MDYFSWLGAEEDLGFEMLRSLDPGQRARAIIAAEAFGDIVTGSDPAVQSLAFAGLPAADMRRCPADPRPRTSRRTVTARVDLAGSS